MVELVVTSLLVQMVAPVVLAEAAERAVQAVGLMHKEAQGQQAQYKVSTAEMVTKAQKAAVEAELEWLAQRLMYRM
jgi:hypothetical protein